MDDTSGSVALLVSRLKQGDEAAIEHVWRCYGRQIRRVARSVVSGLAPGAGDEEDVAQCAFHAFCEAAAEDRLPPINTREELWRVLVAFARRKAVDCVRREFRVRRGGRATVVRGAEAVNGVSDGSYPPLEMVELQEAVDNLRERVALANDPCLTQVARLRFDGLTNPEIAHELGCTVRTIQRKVQTLERLWRGPGE